MLKEKSKIIFVILIFIMVFNFCSPVVFADSTIDLYNRLIEAGVSEEDIPEYAKRAAQEHDKQAQTAKTPEERQKAEKEKKNMEALGDYARSQSASIQPSASTQTSTGSNSIIDFGAGVLAYPFKYIAYWIGKGVYSIVNAVAEKGESVTPESILFNKLSITSIDFFSSSNSKSSFSNSLKKSISTWYVAIRNLAIIASLCVLIYIAIRMAISTAASEKAEYKRMLTDWFISFVLIFVLHFVIVLVVQGNNTLVNLLVPANLSNSTDTNLDTYMTTLEKQVTDHVDFSQSLGAIFVYLIFIALIIAFLIMYIKRMIVIAFLIIIAPLITITYAIDKVADRKSQAMDTWLKEFFWTVFIQPFHCVIYIVFVNTAISSLGNGGTFSGSILAIMCMVFILQAEGIIKKIFGIQANNIGNMSGSFALGAGTMLYAQRLGKKAVSTAGGVAAKTNVVPKFAKTSGTAIKNFSKSVLPESVSNKVGKTVDAISSNETLKKAANFTGKAVSTYAEKSFDAAFMTVGTAFSLPTANGVDDIAKGAIAGHLLGSAFKRVYKGTVNKANDIIENRRTKNRVEDLNKSLNEFKKETKLSDPAMMYRINQLLSMDKNSSQFKNLDQFEKDLVRNIERLMVQMQRTGQNFDLDSVLKKVGVNTGGNPQGLSNNINGNQVVENISNVKKEIRTYHYANGRSQTVVNQARKKNQVKNSNGRGKAKIDLKDLNNGSNNRN